MANGNGETKSTIDIVSGIFKLLMATLIIWLFYTVSGNTNKLSVIEIKGEMRRENIQLQLDDIKSDTKEIKESIKSIAEKLENKK